MLALPAPEAGPPDGADAETAGAQPSPSDHAADGTLLEPDTADAEEAGAVTADAEMLPADDIIPDSEEGPAVAASATVEPQLPGGEVSAESRAGKTEDGKHKGSSVEVGMGAAQLAERGTDVEDTQQAGEPDAAAAADTKPDTSIAAEEAAAVEAPEEDDPKANVGADPDSQAADSTAADAAATDQAADNGKEQAGSAGGSKQKAKRKKGRLATAAAAAPRRQTRGAAHAEPIPPRDAEHEDSGVENIRTATEAQPGGGDDLQTGLNANGEADEDAAHTAAALPPSDDAANPAAEPAPAAEVGIADGDPAAMDEDPAGAYIIVAGEYMLWPLASIDRKPSQRSHDNTE